MTAKRQILFIFLVYNLIRGWSSGNREKISGKMIKKIERKTRITCYKSPKLYFAVKFMS